MGRSYFADNARIPGSVMAIVSLLTSAAKHFNRGNRVRTREAMPQPVDKAGAPLQDKSPIHPASEARNRRCRLR
jgi:hypothetical protein